MQVYNLLLQTATAGVDPHALFTPLPRTETVYPKQVPIFRLDDMLFCVVPKQSTQVYKIRGARHRRNDRPWLCSWLTALCGGEYIEEILGSVIAELNDWRG